MPAGDQIETREFSFSALETVITGAAADSALSRVASRLGAARIFLVGSSSLGAHTDEYAAIRSALGERCVGLHTGVRSHTPRQDVLAVLEKVRAAEADLLVAIGGGSIIDCCKVVQLAVDQGVNSESELLDYAQRADGSRGARAGDYSRFSDRSKIRQLAVPTTLSGAEFSNSAGVLDSATASKEGYRGVDLCARVIIYDPHLARYTPDWLWLSTAIRSLDHAVEGYCSEEVTPYMEAQFLHAMELFANSLPATRQDASDLGARDLNQHAVWLACCALGKVAHGASHGIGYILGSLCAVPHGYTSCVMLPAVLAWNAALQAERQQSICQALGRGFGRQFDSAADAVRTLVASLGLPGTLQEVGVRQEQLDGIATRAIKHPVVRRNPRPLQSAAQVREILELAWG